MDSRATESREAITVGSKVPIEHHDRAGQTRPLVSVMMPAYNCEKYVGEAIESIINQTYTNWELVCVDDGATDRTLKIMQRYAARDSRIRVFANGENKGRPYTRNRILNLARGEILAVQDADDVSLPHRLEEGVKILAAEPDVAVVGSGWIEIDEEGDETGRKWTAPPLDRPLAQVLSEYHVPLRHSTVLMKAEAVHTAGGYDEFFLFAQELDLFFRLEQRYELKTVPGFWCKYRSHPAQATTAQSQEQHLYAVLAGKRAQALSRSEPFHLKAEFNRLKDKAASSLTPRRQKARASYHLGIVYVRSGKMGTARKHFRQAMSDWHLLPRAILGYALTFVPAIIRVPAIKVYFRTKGQGNMIT